jgi:hypothetical protein
MGAGRSVLPRVYDGLRTTASADVVEAQVPAGSLQRFDAARPPELSEPARVAVGEKHAAMVRKSGRGRIRTEY